MILQALTQYYEDLLRRDEIAAPGWSPAKISYALCLNGEGVLTQVVSVETEMALGKKTVLRPQELTLPAAVGKAAGVKSNFLWENSGYLLGIKQNEDAERSLKCFHAARALHHALLDDVDSPIARAILLFFDRWDPACAAGHPALQQELSGITAGGNLLFRVDGHYPQEDAAIRTAWQRHYDAVRDDALRMQCLVTGQKTEIAPTHPQIKGVRGAQSSGAALVSFNASALCSYGREQNYNAPVGRQAAFAYTAALNHLLARRDNVQQIGDATVVCWAAGAEPAYAAFATAVLFGGQPAGLRDNDLRSALQRLAQGLPCPELELDPNRTFYILGLSPNAGRLSVRFFLRNSFGALMRNINAHYERLEIVGKRFDTLPLWALLQETVNPKAQEKMPSPALAGAVTRAVFSGTPYPAALLEAVVLRIRAERNITPGKAAILKAYYLNHAHPDCPKEVLTVSLNESSTNPAYVLGRLFSVYEAVQEAANPGINATIRDKFFSAASATPAVIFPVLNDLCQKHLRKLETGQRIYFERQLMTLKGLLGEAYPARLTLPQQGAFDLGYYHQKQARYTKKEETENV